jgi:hypothetical protein
MCSKTASGEKCIFHNSRTRSRIPRTVSAVATRMNGSVEFSRSQRVTIANDDQLITS